MIRLQAVTAEAPSGALELLTALGDGENGFGGTAVGHDPGKLFDWLDYCAHVAEAKPLSADFPRQTNYWMINASGYVVGLVRIFPQINTLLLNKGGHVGYYVAPAFRNLGYARAALKLALDKLRKQGVKQALVTVESDNTASLSLVESLGGQLEDERIDEATGQAFCRIWLQTDRLR